jgi:RAB protein geranylgeranyltransferase component A
MQVISQDHDMLDLPKSSAPKGKYTMFSQLYHPSCVNYTMEKDNNDNNGTDSSIVSPIFFGYIKDNIITKYRARQLCQRFSIDITSRVLFGAGSTIECLINSEVARYLEFKSIDSLYYLGKDNKQLWNVPSSKGDIFSSKLLSALEKRSLMKFLQFALDWGKENMGTDVSKLNEQELAQGRSLYRPQNKDKLASGLYQTDYRNKPFKQFLKDFKISEHLQSIIVHAMCLSAADDEQDHICTDESLTKLFSHINSLGRYGTTAFLYPLYGCGELSQGFCRMCAVWGGTCILRRRVNHLTLNFNNSFFESAITSVEDNEGRIFECDAFVCGSEQWPFLPRVSSLIISRFGIFDSNILPTNRSMLVIPPKSVEINNSQAIFVIQLDHETMAVPEGTSLLQIITESSINEEVRSKQDWDAYISNNTNKIDSINQEMDNVIKMFMNIKSANELCHTTTIRPKFQACKNGLLDCTNVPKNAAVCDDDILSELHCDNVIKQAKQIFHKLFPNDEFLPLPENPQGDEYGDDMEGDMLRSTLSAALQNTAQNENG